MTVDLRTLVLIRFRIEEAALTLLYHNVRTPSRQARRVSRIMRWLGYDGLEMTRPYVVSMTEPLPLAGGQRWSRGGRPA